MAFEMNLKVGQTLSNKELCEVFKCGNMGRMRKSNTCNTLTLISNHTKGLYSDEWKNDILYFTGTGKIGDQRLNFSQNRTLNESGENNISLFLFEVYEHAVYTYKGKVKLDGEAFQDIQIGDDGEPRKVWIFPLKIV